MNSAVERALHRAVCAATPTPSVADLDAMLAGHPTPPRPLLDVVFDPLPGYRL